MSRAVRRVLATGAAAFAALVACAGPNTAETSARPESAGVPARSIETLDFAPSLGVELSKFTRHRSGFYFRDILPGTGAAAGTDRRVTVRYVVYLPDGTAVETQATPLDIVIGPGIVRGLREGIPGMRVGGTRALILPPNLAYGNSVYGRIPPNATLIFEIELLRVR